MAELAANATDIRLADGSRYFYIVRGWLDDIPAVRGEDDDAPGRPGRIQGNRVAQLRRIILQGQLKGSGATEAAAQASFLALVQGMATLWDPTADPWNLVAGDLYRGLAAGQTATIAVRTVNLVPSHEFNGFRRTYSWELECIANPPAWVLAP